MILFTIAICVYYFELLQLVNSIFNSTHQVYNKSKLNTNDSAAEFNQTKIKKCGIMFLHMRKTGGTFIGNALRVWLRTETTHRCCGISKQSRIKTPCPSAPHFYDSRNYDNWTCSEFHFVEQEYNSYNPDILDISCMVTITSIRDPVQRIISLFLYDFVNIPGFKKAHPNITSNKEMYNVLLQNESLWNSYLDKADYCPGHFFGPSKIVNYYSFALDPWYGNQPENNDTTKNISTIIYQKSNEMWVKNDKQLHQKRCNRSNISMGVQRSLDYLSKFSLVLTDTNKENWTRDLLQILNTTDLGTSQGRNNSKDSKGSDGLYNGVPSSVLDRIKSMNKLDIAIYQSWQERVARNKKF